MKLFKVEGLQIWWVVAEDVKDVRPIIFQYESQFCSTREKVLEDIRETAIKEVEDNPFSFDLSKLDTPRVIRW